MKIKYPIQMSIPADVLIIESVQKEMPPKGDNED